GLRQRSAKGLHLGCMDMSACQTPADKTSNSTILKVRNALVEIQAEFADLNLNTSAQRDLVDTVAVDVGTIQRSDVAERERRVRSGERGVPTRHGHSVQEDIRVWMAACDALVGVQQEACALVGSGMGDQQRRTSWQGGNCVFLILAQGVDDRRFSTLVHRRK